MYLARQDDILRVLDLDRDRFYGLDAIASQLLTVALERGQDAAIADVARTYHVEPARVRKDLETLLADLKKRHLLEGHAPVRRWLPLGPAVGPCRVHGPVTTLVAGRMLRRAWWSLRLNGWASTLQLWRRPAGLTPAVDPDEADAVIAAVDGAIRDAAAQRLFLPMACKERAVVGHHLLRVVYGLPATLVVGVQHYPFGAHAWVEIGGRIVTDDEGHCGDFEPAARFA